MFLAGAVRPQDGSRVRVRSGGALAVVAPVDRDREEAARGQRLEQRLHAFLAVARAVQHDHGRPAALAVVSFMVMPGTRSRASVAKLKCSRASRPPGGSARTSAASGTRARSISRRKSARADGAV